MEQLYILRFLNSNGNLGFPDMAFKDYAEARKKARQIIEQKNKTLTYHSILKSENNSTQPFYNEVYPDVWECDQGRLTIEVINIVSPKKRRKKSIQEKSLDSYLNLEIEIKNV